MAEPNILFENLNRIIASSDPVTDSLLCGRLGICLYYYNLYQMLGNWENAEKAVGHLELVFEHWNNDSRQLEGGAYSYGAAGLGYVCVLLQKEGLVEIDVPENFRELDNGLCKDALDKINNDGDIDPLHGAVGLLQYFNCRGDEDYILQYIEEIVKALSVRIVSTDNGNWIKNSRFEKKPQINLSLSHGLCGYLTILLDTCKLGICKDHIEKWVTDGIQLLLHHYRLPNYETGDCQQFPSVILLENIPKAIYTSRLAWCYGDLNVVWLLYKAAKQFRNETWRQLADKCGIETTKRLIVEATMVTDSHFCHGAAGVATIYSSLYNAAGLLAYKDAADYWLQKTFDYVSKEIETGFYLGKETNLLEGLPGVNLAILSAISNKPNDWAKALFI